MVAVHHIRRILPPLAAVLVLGACVRSEPSTPAPGAIATDGEPSLSPAGPAVATVSPMTDGHQDLALAGSDGLAAGTLVQVRDGGSGNRKGLAVIVSAAVDGAPRARLTALDDAARPVAAGDAVEPCGDPTPATPASEPATTDPLLAATQAALDDALVRLAAAERIQNGTDALLAAMHGELQRLHRDRDLVRQPTPDPRSQLGSELARIEAERAYFALAAQVLRLPATPDGIAALQASLRTALAARADLDPETAHAP